MKILIDIGHPAHVHYFKNLIKILNNEGYEFIITANKRKIVYELLVYYGIEFIPRIDNTNGLINKGINIFKADYKIYQIAKKFKPDIFLGFSGTYISHVAWLMGKPSIVIDDTGHAKLAHMSYKAFASIIITPSCFSKDFGRKHIRFNSYMELCYLHPKYYTPKGDIRKNLNIGMTEKICILRFVSWEASHDIGQTGLTMMMKQKLVSKLSEHSTVLISSESELPDNLKKYQFQFLPEEMHDVLYNADLFIGEGATMASECAMLGTPAIYVNSLDVGTCTEQEKKYNLVYNFRNSEGVLEKAMELLNIPNLKQEFQKRRQRMLADKIDTTEFLVKIIKDLPVVLKRLKNAF